MMTKIHHAAVDGVTLLEITSALNDLTPDATAPEPTTEWRPEPVPTPFELLSRAAINSRHEADARGPPHRVRCARWGGTATRAASPAELRAP